jgi:hypothetical protein
VDFCEVMGLRRVLKFCSFMVEDLGSVAELLDFEGDPQSLSTRFTVFRSC